MSEEKRQLALKIKTAKNVFLLNFNPTLPKMYLINIFKIKNTSTLNKQISFMTTLCILFFLSNSSKTFFCD
jgi:hypothetical protein